MVHDVTGSIADLCNVTDGGQLYTKQPYTDISAHDG